jgi:hypothetical protein
MTLRIAEKCGEAFFTDTLVCNASEVEQPLIFLDILAII